MYVTNCFDTKHNICAYKTRGFRHVGVFGVVLCAFHNSRRKDKVGN